MTLKKYKTIKIIVTFLLAFIFSQAIILENFLIPIGAMVIATLILLILRRKVKEIVADERDYIIGGKSALLAMQVFSWISVIAMFVLYSFRHLNPFYEVIGSTLAYSTCLLMIIYSLVFHFYNRATFSENKWRYVTIAIVLAIFITFFSIRLFSGEDNWVCKNGQWVKHGNPSFEAPSVECK